MNIFITHKNHQQSASNLDDLRLGCQIKELAQILSTAIYNKIADTSGPQTFKLQTFKLKNFKPPSLN